MFSAVHKNVRTATTDEPQLSIKVSDPSLGSQSFQTTVPEMMQSSDAEYSTSHK